MQRSLRQTRRLEHTDRRGNYLATAAASTLPKKRAATNAVATTHSNHHGTFDAGRSGWRSSELTPTNSTSHWPYVVSTTVPLRIALDRIAARAPGQCALTHYGTRTSLPSSRGPSPVARWVWVGR